jgi:hypothetical protein
MIEALRRRLCDGQATWLSSHTATSMRLALSMQHCRLWTTGSRVGRTGATLSGHRAHQSSAAAARTRQSRPPPSPASASTASRSMRHIGHDGALPSRAWPTQRRRHERWNTWPQGSCFASASACVAFVACGSSAWQMAHVDER